MRTTRGAGHLRPIVGLPRRRTRQPSRYPVRFSDGLSAGSLSAEVIVFNA